MLFLFIKDYQRVQIQRNLQSNLPVIPFISESISEWIETTWVKYQIDLTVFVVDWLMYFSDHEEIWPITHRKKSKESWRKYEYDYRQKSNLFNLDSLYRDMPKKLYTKGKKQWFEIIMMYEWLHSFIGDEESLSYWEEYSRKTLPSIDKIFLGD